jgi:glucose-1-phosphate cytidylyltransferase
MSIEPVVLLAGGLGTRLREGTESRPKPMLEIGGRPILWHIMKYFAQFGHTEFIICAGYKSEVIADFLLNYRTYNEDFTLTLGSDNPILFQDEGGGGGELESDSGSYW